MLIRVRVKTEERVEKITPLENGWEVRLKEPAKENRANTRLLELMREKYPDAKQIKIIAGHHSPAKILEIGL